MSLMLLLYDAPMKTVVIEGKQVLPVVAYHSELEWLLHFRQTFPNKAARMDAYSSAQGWGHAYGLRAWLEPALSWYKKRASVERTK